MNAPAESDKTYGSSQPIKDGCTQTEEPAQNTKETENGTATAHLQQSEKGVLHEPHPTTNLEEGIVGWEGQDDPHMPLNFPPWRKWTWVALLSAITFLTPFASSILAPAIEKMSLEFGNNNAVIGSMSVSIYLLGYVVGPVFIAPLSEIYGRKHVLALSNVFFCIWQIPCALAPNIATLIVARFFCGVGGAACLTLGGGIVGDLFLAEERGFAIGIWNLGPLLGPAIGPLVGGFLTDNIDWRFDFWIILAAAAPITILMVVVTNETSHKVLIQKKTNRLCQELGRHDLISCYDSDHSKGQITTQFLLTSLVRPLEMLFTSPLVFFLSLYIAFVYGVLYLLYTTIPSVFKDIYGFTASQVGLVYLAIGLGNILGWTALVLWSDKTVIRLAKANGGVFEPEMRLTLSIFMGMFLPVTMFWYGWSTFYHIHVASTIISLVPFGFGILGIFLSIVTYVVDSHPTYAASALAANVILRSLVGALLPLAGPPMYETLGLGWGNSLLGFICVAMIPLPFLFYRIGGRLRKTEKYCI